MAASRCFARHLRVGHAASAALLLALLDADCCLWLSPTLCDSDAAAWLRFHTGCQLTATPAHAQFAWVAAGDTLPSLESFAGGSENYPDQSTTCVIDVLSLASGGADDWRLSGPGIPGETNVGVQGLPPDFVAQWAANHAAFPRGVDLFLATPQQIVGLPRSTRIEHTVEV
ncbi:MAG: phosphonate C-P lyase system protein PhnH [Hylemonella sp.]